MNVWMTILRRVWRRKWEATVTAAGLLITLAFERPSPIVAILWLLFAVLLIVDVVFDLRSTHRLIREKHLPIMVLAGVKDDAFRAMTDDVLAVMRSHDFREDLYRTEFGLSRDDWIVRRARDLPLRHTLWVQMIDDFERKINRLAGRLEGREVFHVFLKCPAALAMPLGAVVRNRYVVVLHHYSDGAYIPVLDFDTQDLASIARAVPRQSEDRFTYIRVRGTEEARGQVFVALGLAAHSPTSDVQQAAQVDGADRVVIIDNTYDNRLDPKTPEAWLRVTREVVTVLLELVQKPAVERVHVFLSAPLVLAMAIGIGVGTQSPVTVYHWFREIQEYRAIFNLEGL